MRLPNFKSNAGNKIISQSLFQGGGRFYVQNSTRKEAEEYARELVECGFTLYACNKFETGNGYKNTENLSYSFVCEEGCVFLFYDAALLTAFVTATERCEMPENIRGESSPSKSPLFFSQLKLVGGGMSYALRLPD